MRPVKEDEVEASEEYDDFEVKIADESYADSKKSKTKTKSKSKSRKIPLTVGAKRHNNPQLPLRGMYDVSEKTNETDDRWLDGHGLDISRITQESFESHDDDIDDDQLQFELELDTSHLHHHARHHARHLLEGEEKEEGEDLYLEARDDDDHLELIIIKEMTDEELDDLLRGAKNGDAKSMFNIGYNYHFGEYGFPQDYKMAYRWYEKAHRAGDVSASFVRAGMLLEGGPGVPRNTQEGILYLGIAAAMGNEFAALKLGLAFANGEYGLVVNNTEAISWLQKARHGKSRYPKEQAKKKLQELSLTTNLLVSGS